MESQSLTTSTVDPSVIATGRAAIQTCVEDARREGHQGVFLCLTAFDCEYIVDSIEDAHGRKPTPAECDYLGISVGYALTAFDLEG